MGKKIIERKKDEVKTLTPFIETRDCGAIANKTGNLYASINVIAKRANQINSKVKEELHKKLEEFASTTDNLEEVFENREQIEISKFYERLPKPVLVALNEFHNDEIYHRPQGETK
ncbi:MAG: DNA-directed RNA polymerase subunit omega [Bacteroidetes bacterium]|jgi:DNA-directed RNA polymerase subunit K/omega|nr:DNA-directed RNA polymerase subunit omega [Bacteroidota bacterium]MBP7256413.1 DNA-directed RNA polymerase subunit omega [Chitinophagales bacterium]MBK7139743.1 DNA-directed RNA polymerase subunit omega [Bacteroidota bacterium]MBK7505923.1 DNA-directed RNA polymerase subunit omega [Bacteroidota bacterium]MBK7639230.1 DNA-directed RNA polymerase subunit omega [Bacteroidota bacterium]